MRTAKVFRPTKRYWQKTVLHGIGLLLFALLAGIGLNKFRQPLLIGFAALLIFISTAVFLVELWFHSRTWVALDEETIYGHTGWRPFSFFWHEIVWIHLKEYPNGDKALVIDARDRGEMIGLSGFDQTIFWQTVEQYAPPAALDKETVKQLDEYQQAVQKIENKLPFTLHVSRFWRSFFGAATALLLFSSWMSWQAAGAPKVVPLFLVLFALLCLYIFLALQKTVVLDEKTIAVRSGRKICRIRWDEITLSKLAKEANGMQFGMTLYGRDNQRLLLPAPNLWIGPRKTEAVFFFHQQLEDRQIPVKTSLFLPFFNKNVCD